jgi:hypothetical protein
MVNLPQESAIRASERAISAKILTLTPRFPDPSEIITPLWAKDGVSGSCTGQQKRKFPNIRKKAYIQNRSKVGNL